MSFKTVIKDHFCSSVLLKCPHYVFEKWHQCQYFLKELLPHMEEWLIDTNGGELMSKSVTKVWDFF